MPGSIASTEDGERKATPTTTVNNSPTFSATNRVDSAAELESRISGLNLNDSRTLNNPRQSSAPMQESVEPSRPSAEETVAQKRREWYAEAWKKFLEKNNYDGVITSVERYLEITDKSVVDVDCYFALVSAVSAKKLDELKSLDKIDMSALSDSDLLDIHLLRSLVYLKLNDVETAQEEARIASEKAHALGQENECHWIAALISCYTEDYVEAAFRKSLLPDGFQPKERLALLIKRLTFSQAKWQITSINLYSGKPRYATPIDISKELPIPSKYLI